jgi:hypothetical protein
VPTLLAWPAAGLGGLLVLATAASVLGTLLIPRDRVGPVTRVVDGAVSWLFRTATDRVRDYGRRDAILAAHAPAILIGQLAVWLVLFACGYTLLLLPAAGTVHHAAREATSSMFTLGFTATHGWWPTAIDGLAAVTGLVVVALQIAYLPTLYGAFNRRETEVTLLAVRAGEPAWGPELLARTQYGVLGVDLATFYAVWERWAADIAESHASYPVLLRFRSPRPLGSWVVALLAVLDAAAMHHAVSPVASPVQGRLCLRMGFIAFRRLARTAGIAVEDDPHPYAALQVTEAEFAEAYDRLAQIGFPLERSAAEAWPHFRGWRVNYETAAYALAYRLDAVPARWSGPRRVPGPVIPTVRPPNRTPEAPDDPGAPRFARP